MKIPQVCEDMGDCCFSKKKRDFHPHVGNFVFSYGLSHCSKHWTGHVYCSAD